LFPHADAKSWFAGNQPVIDATAFRNSSLQGAYLMLAARAVGLDCGPMSGFDADKVNAAFFAGTEVKVNFICNLGYGDAEKLFPRSPRLTFDEACKII
jgi:3-hydroxypropanoate dehydrogenase